MSEEIRQPISEIREEINGEKTLYILYTTAYFMPAKSIYVDIFLDLLATTEEADAAIIILKQKSLIKIYGNDESFVIKKMIQTEIREYLKQIGQETKYLALAVSLLQYKLAQNETHPNCVDHAISLLTHIREFPQLVKFSALLPNLVVLTLMKQNRLKEAFEFGKNALEFLKQVLGETHAQSLDLEHSLGLVQGMEGKHAKAEKISKELHEKDIKYSSEQEKVGSLIMQARELCELSKYEEALLLYQELLGNKEVLETFDKNVLVAWNDYGTLLNDMGRHDEAINVLLDVLVQKRIVRTDDDPYGIATRRNLGIAFMAKQSYNKALKYLKDSVFEGEERLGKLHPDTLRAERDIGLVLLNKSDFEEALKILEEVEDKFKQVLRSNHPDILCTRANIITALINLEKYDKALKISQVVYEDYRNSLGEKHNETLRVKNHIGSIFLRQGKFKEAVGIFQDVYSGFLDVFGPNHYSTIEVKATIDALGWIPQESGSKSKTLHEAIQRGDLSQVIDLIGKNADVDEEDSEGRRPLHYAALNGHIDIVKYLLKKGAMYDAENSKGETPLALAYESRTRSLLISVRNLFKNVKKGRQTNLTEKAELVNVRDKKGYTLLHWAVNGSLNQLVQELLDAGCKPKCVSLKGNTPLHTAASKGNVTIAEILLKSVTARDLRYFLNAKTTEKGNTALHIAAKNNNLDMVKCLLKYGAYYDTPNKEGETPVQLSSSQSIRDLLNMTRKLFSSFQEGNPDVVTELKSLGIDNCLIVTNARNREGHTMLQVAASNKHRYIGHELSELLQRLNNSQRRGN